MIFGPLVVSGVMSGSGGFTKTGSQEVVLDADNDYTGTTFLNSGALQVNGSQPASPIVFNGSATLRGSGRAGAITTSSSGGIINPGYFGTAILSSSNVTLSSSILFVAEMFGTVAGTDYDQLNVSGAVNLVNVNLIPFVGFTPAPGDSFIIINNDGADSVNGTFNGFPEGTVFTNNGTALKISYAGGDGNDVVLQAISPSAQLTAITALTNGVKQIEGLGLSNLTYTIQAASNLNPVITWTNLGSATANGSGMFMFTDTNAPGFPMRFYRAKSP
jgi:autotransporter-associated beta strand protein